MSSAGKRLEARLLKDRREEKKQINAVKQLLKQVRLQLDKLKKK